MLDRVLSYVQSVLAGEVEGDAAVGRYLMDALGPSTEDIERGEFNSHLQVRLFHFPPLRTQTDPRLGYHHGVIPRKSGPVTSGGIVTSGVGEGVIVLVSLYREPVVSIGRACVLLSC